MIYQVIVKMESMEHWTLDGDPELEEALVKLGETLENIGGVDLKSEEELIQLLVLLKVSRALYIMQCIDMACPGAASKLLTYAEEHVKDEQDIFSLFLSRNISFERLRLFARIFSANRLNLIQRALEVETG